LNESLILLGDKIFVDCKSPANQDR